MLFNAIAITIGGLAIGDLIFFGWLFLRIRRDERAAQQRKQAELLDGGAPAEHGSDCGCPHRHET